MAKRIISFLVIFVFTFSILGVTFVQAQEGTKIKGKVEQIVEAENYMVVGGTKIITTPEFLEDSEMEIGDEVEVTVEQTEQGPKAIDYDYLFLE